jgi:hypothetical protein
VGRSRFLRLEPFGQVLLHGVQVGHRPVDVLAQGVAQFFARIAVTEHRVEFRAHRADRVLLVFRRLRAEGVGQERVDLHLQGLDPRIPAFLDARRIEHAQFLDAPADLVDRTFQLFPVVRAQGPRSGFCSGHSGPHC